MKNAYLKQLVKSLLKIKNPKEMEEFLKGLLTAQELDSVPVRIEIVRMLKAGVPQREIVKKLKVGVATVTRGSRELKLKRFKNV
ncbi:MAG: Trp repressor, TrpR family transcriptional regulator, trp operon repressor [Candidatus Peregrinibacteria bacterium GW2011_GWF2_38_29]|nr:MAG: Trp repressor, TrpR family transcriptional regulator, trp operon repressor [Candidatus Peregrinibacteria bacterium GW2011_GWF2_38_29]HBB03250.1 transcriptional regulator [Candidatus Peregrinibacteria bacterium]